MRLDCKDAGSPSLLPECTRDRGCFIGWMRHWSFWQSRSSALWPYPVLHATLAILIIMLFMVPVKWGNISGSVLLPLVTPFWHSFPSHFGFDNSSAIDFSISKSSLHWGINKIIHIACVCMLFQKINVQAVSFFVMDKVIFEAVWCHNINEIQIIHCLSSTCMTL